MKVLPVSIVVLLAIYAWGLRNIWRMAFDPKTGDRWAADVGQNEWEDVNIIRRGGNDGWSLRESAHRFTLGGGFDGEVLMSTMMGGGRIYRFVKQ